jgi:hypothetical protein
MSRRKDHYHNDRLHGQGLPASLGDDTYVKLARTAAHKAARRQGYEPIEDQPDHYRKGHAIWALRPAEDDSGFVLVRQRDERAPDLLAIETTAHVEAPTQKTASVRRRFYATVGQRVRFVHRGQLSDAIVVLVSPEGEYSDLMVEDTGEHITDVPTDQLSECDCDCHSDDEAPTQSDPEPEQGDDEEDTSELVELLAGPLDPFVPKQGQRSPLDKLIPQAPQTWTWTALISWRSKDGSCPSSQAVESAIHQWIAKESPSWPGQIEIGIGSVAQLPNEIGCAFEVDGDYSSTDFSDASGDAARADIEDKVKRELWMAIDQSSLADGRPSNGDLVVDVSVRTRTAQARPESSATPAPQASDHYTVKMRFFPHLHGQGLDLQPGDQLTPQGYHYADPNTDALYKVPNPIYPEEGQDKTQFNRTRFLNKDNHMVYLLPFEVARFLTFVPGEEPNYMSNPDMPGVADDTTMPAAEPTFLGNDEVTKPDR